MKTKIFAVLAVAVMMAAAFVGIGAISSSDDSEGSNTTVINELSGTVDYVPATVNVSGLGHASFIPTVNWVTVTAAYSVALSVKISATNGSYDTANVVIQSGTDDVATISVSGSTVTVTGSDVSANETSTFWVQSTATITNGATVVATRSISQQVTVNTYTGVSATTAVTCYFGEALSTDLATGGSGTYAVTVTGSSGTGATDIPVGLYVLNNELSGYAERANFSTADSDRTLTIKVIDAVSGDVVTGSLVITMKLYRIITVSVTGTNGSPVQTVNAGDTVYSDEGDTVAATITAAAGTTTLALSVDGAASSVITSGTAVSLPTTVIGLHTYVVTYNVGGTYTGTYTFYMLVVENGDVFIVPDPSITISV